MSATASAIAYGTSGRPGGPRFERDPKVNGKEKMPWGNGGGGKERWALGGRSSRRARKCPRKLRRTRQNYALRDYNAFVKSRDVLAATLRCTGYTAGVSHRNDGIRRLPRAPGEKFFGQMTENHRENNRDRKLSRRLIISLNFLGLGAVH